MNFGEILKQEREDFEISVKKLSELSNVSTAYISKLENNKRNFPTIETIYNLLFGFKNLIEERYGSDKTTNQINSEYLKEILKMFINATDSNLKEKNIDLLYRYFIDFYNEKLEMIMHDNSQIEEAIYTNRIELNKGTTNKKELEKPYLDLKWLLNQNDFEVFYGREFIFDKNLSDKPNLNERDMFFYNTLNERDLETIKNLIEIFLENKYIRVKQDKTDELFNMFTNKKNIEHNQFKTSVTFYKLLNEMRK